MIKINFEGNNVDFWQIVVFSIKNKIPIHEILKQANSQQVLADDAKEILSNFINYFADLKKNHYAQIFQDIFASFVVKNKFDNTFLEFGATNGRDLSNTFLLEKNN